MPTSVFESTTDVASELPFQRMTAVFVKFVPTTFIVWVLEPAVSVRGRTWVIFGVASGIARSPQPTTEKQNPITILVPIALKIPKTHP